MLLEKSLTNKSAFAIMNHGDCEAVTCAAVAQSVERRIGSAEVTGPIPVSSSDRKGGNLDYKVSAF